jgi:hypothetical protein
VLHRSDRRPASVRPVTPGRSVDRAGQAGSYSSCTTRVPESLNDFSRPWNKNTPKTQPAQKENPTQSRAKQLQTDQQHHDPKTHESSSTPEVNPTSGIHRSDRSHTLVKPGQLGMNSTHGSTAPNPTPDLPNRSTDLHKTLGIVGPPNEEFIAKFMLTKSCQIKRNRRNPAKNSSNL